MEKQKIILLEGPDCAGKSTLAKYICDNFGYLYIHAQYEKGMDVKAHHQEIINEVKDNYESNYVVDRFALSEYIYGLTYRNTWYGQKVYDNLMSELSPTLKVLCIPPLGIVRKSFYDKDRKEMYEKIEPIYDMYFKFLMSGIPDTNFKTYDWTFQSPQQIMELL